LIFDFGECAAGGAVGACVAHSGQAFVCFVAADLALRFRDPLLEKFQPVVDDLRASCCRWQARVAVFDGLLDSVVGAAAEFGGGTKRSGQVVGIEHVHEFSVRLHSGLSCGGFDTD